MKALLVRVGADQSEGGGFWNGPVNSQTGVFAYVPIPEMKLTRPNLSKPYAKVAEFGLSLPSNLTDGHMHLDPDFSHLTYGDQGQRAVQIQSKLGEADLLVFYAGLADTQQNKRLVYALIGSMKHGASTLNRLSALHRSRLGVESAIVVEVVVRLRNVENKFVP